MVGAVQSILSKSAKCALFDPTLQMAYIPLDNESKVLATSIHCIIDGIVIAVNPAKVLSST
jgi:ATP/ADP translocase